jgi:glutamine amidotransferase PdxT
MSEKRKKEIIENLEGAIARGGESDAITKLKVILENVKNDTHTIAKRKGRTPKPKEE